MAKNQELLRTLELDQSSLGNSNARSKPRPRPRARRAQRDTTSASESESSPNANSSTPPAHTADAPHTRSRITTRGTHRNANPVHESSTPLPDDEAPSPGKSVSPPPSARATDTSAAAAIDARALSSAAPASTPVASPEASATNQQPTPCPPPTSSRNTEAAVVPLAVDLSDAPRWIQDQFDILSTVAIPPDTYRAWNAVLSSWISLERALRFESMVSMEGSICSTYSQLPFSA